MSPFGTKRTCQGNRAMSDIRVWPDLVRTRGEVRFWPRLGHSRTSSPGQGMASTLRRRAWFPTQSRGMFQRCRQGIS